MYLEHYGFDELPFTLTPNTSYFFALERHKEALQVALGIASSATGGKFPAKSGSLGRVVCI